MRNMKTAIPTFVLVLASTCTLQSSANAAKVCVAELNQSINYSSYNQYIVTCDDGKNFRTKKNITTFLLPIPYAWKKVAKQNLDTAMKKIGLEEVGSIRAQFDAKSTFNPLVIYAKPGTTGTQAPKSYLVVFPTNVKKTGIHANVVRLDAVISHSDGRQDQILMGITESELKKVLADSGFTNEPIHGTLESAYNRYYTREISLHEFRLYSR
jgi:hypothetical protein